MRPNRSMPHSQIILELAYPDVSAAAEWLCKVFGFSERLRIGKHRVQLSFGTGDVILTSGAVQPETCASHSVMVRVENVDEHFAQAQAAGVRVGDAPRTYPYGERQYAAEDFAGHRWVFSQSIADVDPSEWGGLLVRR